MDTHTTENPMRAVKRALFAFALACAAAPAEAQIAKVTGTALSLTNALFAGGAATYSWEEPAEGTFGHELIGYILHVRVKPAMPAAWGGFSFLNNLPEHVSVAGIEVPSSFRGRTLGRGTGLILRGLQGGTTYEVRIRGREVDGDNGPWSDVSEIAVPAAPARLTASRSGNAISVNWNAVAGATGYKIRWSRRGQDWINDNAAAGEDVAGTSHSIPNLLSGQSYNLQVRATTGAGPGAWTAAVDQSGRVLSTDATLSGLLITDESGADLGALTPAFDPGLGADTLYKLAVANATSAIRVKATANHASPVSITVSASNNRPPPPGKETLAPAEVASGALSPSIPLNTGPEDFANISVVVVAEDGATTLEYRVSVDRLSNDATASDIILVYIMGSQPEETGEFSPAFVPGDPAQLEYRVEVPNATTSVTPVVTPTAGTSPPSIQFVSAGTATVTNTNFEAAGAWGGALPLTAGTPRELMITITAQDGTRLTYTLTIVRLGEGSADSTLSGLAVAHAGGAATLTKIGGDGSAGFASAHMEYAATFESTVGSVSITPTVNESNASITLGKRGETASAATGGGANTQTLDFGENTLEVTVTAQNGAQRIYTLALTRTPQATDATLRALGVSEGELLPGFAAAVTTYEVRVLNDITAITLTPAVNESHATVTVAGASVASGAASEAQSLAEGANRMEVVVTAENGASMTYVVVVTRAPPVASSNANLSALRLLTSEVSLDLRTDLLSQAKTVGNSEASVKIQPTVEDTGKATVTVDGESVTSGQDSAAIALEVNVQKTISVVVTAEDSTTTKTYTLKVTRARSGDRTLSGLTLSAGALVPGFAATTLHYTAEVAHATTSITLTPMISHPTATATIAGAAVASGEASAPQMLAVGENQIDIVVTAQNESVNTYGVTVTRAKSPDATLSGLALSSGTLVPKFLPATANYTASVANATAAITITPTVNHPDASVTVANVAVTSGTASGSQALGVGDNTILIVVTAPDASAMTYTLVITRAQFVASSDATLSGLSITPGTLAENFAAATLAYTAAVENSAESITVTPVVNHSGASVTVDGSTVASNTASDPIALAANVPKVIEVVVTAQNAGTKTYTLTITRQPGVPGLPQNLAAAGGSAKLRVTWTAPADENGSAVTGYKIRWKNKTDTNFGGAVDASGTSHSILGLAAGEYQVQIRAVNAEGEGGFSDSAEGAARAYSVDVDEDGGITVQDAIMLARYMLGVRGAGLTAGQSRASADVIEENVENGVLLGLLDINGAGGADGDDGILVARYALGMRGDALFRGVADGADSAAQAAMLGKLGELGL